MSFAGWLFIGAFSLVVYCVLEAIYRFKYMSKGKKKLPCQTPLPLIGNALHFMKDRTNEGLYDAFDSYLPDYPVSGLWIGPKFLLMISDADHTNNLLSKGYASKKPSEMYKAFDYATDGVFSTRDMKKWKALRKPLDRMMQPKYVDTWREVFLKNADSFCGAIAANPTNPRLERMSSDYAVLNICETHMGIEDLTDMKKNLEHIFHDLHEAFNLIVLRAFDVTGEVQFIYELTPNCKKLNTTLNRLLNMMIDEFDKRLLHLKKKDVGMDTYTCFTDVILRYTMDRNLGLRETAKAAADFFGAAVHTTTNSLACTILFLAIHPEYQEKAYKEQCDVMKDFNKMPTSEEMNKMEYLDMIMKEALRHSGVPGLARKLDKDVDLDGYVAPAGSIIWFNFLKMNIDPKYWERPTEFYPEHFSKEAEAKRPKGAFNPFSQGMRGCVGKLYAVEQIKLALCRIIQRFRFTSHLRFEDLKFIVNVVRIPQSFACVAHPRELPPVA